MAKKEVDGFAAGTLVLSSDGKNKGRLIGGSRRCPLEGCMGKQLSVRWDDGDLTWPCTKGMLFDGKCWQIGMRRVESV